jgi:hypothetical protein
MGNKKMFGERFLQYQNYVHYFLLAGALSFITPMNSFLDYLKILGMVFGADTIIHFIFWNLPKKFRWRD